MRRMMLLAGVLAAGMSFAGCSSRTGTGALVGAGAGGLIGSQSGNFGKGAAIGAGVGAASGWVLDQMK